MELPPPHHELDMESLAPTVVAISVSLMTATTLVVGLRLYTRLKIIKITGADDATIVVAQVFAITVSVLTILEAEHGLGRHSWTVQRSDVFAQLTFLYANTLVYNFAQTLLKLSFLLQYRRLFAGPKTQAICLILLAFISLWGIAQEFIVGFACSPLTLLVPKMVGKCIPSLPVWFLTSGMNIATDLIIFTIPLPSVVRLKIEIKQRVLLVALFGLGFFTCAISLIRISTLQRATETTDPTWDNTRAAYWSVAELNCGILCACLPTLRPLMHQLFPCSSSTYGSESDDTPATITISRRKSHPITLDGDTGFELEYGYGDGVCVLKDDEIRSPTDTTDCESRDWDSRTRRRYSSDSGFDSTDTGVRIGVAR